MFVCLCYYVCLYVIMYVYACSGLAGKPGVYAEITSVLDWLLENSDTSDPVTAQPIPDGCAIPAWFGDNVMF